LSLARRDKVISPIVALFLLFLLCLVAIPVAKGSTAQTVITSPNLQASGYFGSSVAVTGGITVIGAASETVSGNVGAGRAYLYNVQTGSLTATLTSPNSQAGGSFGTAVATDGNIVVIGADDENSFIGNAYIFNAQTGSLTETLTPSAGGYFGSSVAVDGNIVVVGAYGATVDGYSAAGRVYIFNAQTGAVTGTLTSPNPQQLGAFGGAVAISGNTLVVGAAGETAGGDSSAGRAYIFNAQTGALTETLTSPNLQSNGGFGGSVAIDGNTVVVGAPGENIVAGRVYIFNAETGVLVATLVSPNTQSDGYFGNLVAVRGNTVVVGAPSETVAGNTLAGRAYIFNAQTGALTEHSACALPRMVIQLSSVQLTRLSKATLSPAACTLST